MGAGEQEEAQEADDVEAEENLRAKDALLCSIAAAGGAAPRHGTRGACGGLQGGPRRVQGSAGWAGPRRAGSSLSQAAQPALQVEDKA